MEEYWGFLVIFWRIDWGLRVVVGDLIRVFVKCRREILEVRFWGDVRGFGEKRFDVGYVLKVELIYRVDVVT